MNTVTLSCVGCHVSYTVSPPSVARGRKYCSPSCFASTGYGTLAERFWAKVAKGDGCWEWTGKIASKTGYGFIERGGNTGIVSAHRVSWKLHHGEIPPKMCVCHRCDNRKCVRPEHLFLGTQSENIKDMWAKGRQNPHQDPRLRRLAALKPEGT